MLKSAITIGPLDHGRRMTLDEFDHAAGEPGRLYELSRGVITVVDVPGRRHLAQVDALRQQFDRYRTANPSRIHRLAGSGECKILIGQLHSERHPDLAVYKTAAPEEEEGLWATWIPEIVIEVVSPGSEQRDYVEKREEYLLFGVLEYWIIDADKQEMLVLRRSGGQWAERTVRPADVYRTRLLPGFDFDIAAVFQAASTL